MGKFKVEDRVRLTGTDHEGRVHFVNHAGSLDVEFTDGDGFITEFIPEAWLELLEPSGFPVRKGDVWKTADGVEWFGRDSTSNSRMYAVPDNCVDWGLDMSFESEKAAFIARKPVLIRRK